MLYDPIWWLVAAVVLIVVEMTVAGPEYIGLSIGAATVALVLWPFGASIEDMAYSVPALVVLFALATLAGWLILRRIVGIRPSQNKVITRDINES